MLFTNRSILVATTLSLFGLAGCQTTTPVPAQQSPDFIEAKTHAPVATASDVAAIEVDFSSNELSLAGQMFNSPNLYLTHPMPVPIQASAEFLQAMESLDKDDISLASEQLNKLTISYPSLSGPWLKLGDIALSTGNERQAIAHFSQAISLNPHNYVARGRLASLLREQGDFSGAQAQYQQALKTWPGLVSAHINLGILYDLYLGDKQQALAHYKLAQKLNELDNKPLNKQLKIWIVDVDRQLKLLAKQQG